MDPWTFHAMDGIARALWLKASRKAPRTTPRQETPQEAYDAAAELLVSVETINGQSLRTLALQADRQDPYGEGVSDSWLRLFGKAIALHALSGGVRGGQDFAIDVPMMSVWMASGRFSWSPRMPLVNPGGR